MLKYEVKTKWLKALRSNQYKQGFECLRTRSGTFCCLGVLCDTVHPTNWEIIRNKAIDIHPFYMFGYKGESDGFLVPKTIREEIGLDLSEMRKLSDMNDSGRKNFKAIALYIEKYL
jgi:hypothetical protein